MFIYKNIKLIRNKVINYKFKKKISNLVKSGLKLGKNVTIMPKAIIDSTYPYLISIGDNCSISNGVHIFSHDGTTLKFNGGYEKIDKVEIRENTFIGVNAIILPGVVIGPNVSIAAGSLVNKNIPPNSCVAGVPARVYGKFDDLVNQHKENISKYLTYDSKDLATKIEPDQQEKIRKGIEEHSSFVKVIERFNKNLIT